MARVDGHKISALELYQVREYLANTMNGENQAQAKLDGFSPNVIEKITIKDTYEMVSTRTIVEMAAITTEGEFDADETVSNIINLIEESEEEADYSDWNTGAGNPAW